MKNKKLILTLSGFTFILWTGYSVAECTTKEETQAKSSLAYHSLYSLPDDMQAEYEVLTDKASDLAFENDYSGACQFYDQLIQKVDELKASGKICTSDQVLEKIDKIWNIAPQLNELSAEVVEKFRLEIDQANELGGNFKRLEACALYDQILKEAEALGIKPDK